MSVKSVFGEKGKRGKSAMIINSRKDQPIQTRKEEIDEFEKFDEEIKN